MRVISQHAASTAAAALLISRNQCERVRLISLLRFSNELSLTWPTAIVGPKANKATEQQARRVKMVINAFTAWI